ncbi:hypothetical protein BGM26_02920 [Bacillus sp. FJAT-29790]|uniref:hypothetical protein n=1 Tax=Bacillus sp. FJAT-29790 TaxID=1895002 RepID=UPI001C23E61C|nr:hypothetical protein [Bacillus sp. FJAT-29790]MBU8877945.1 hypothetical protein [Bacillus sp. FJAT-29790]
MKYEEIAKLLQYNKEYESKLFMPNEIFKDLKANIKNTPHIAFAYSYIYLVTWLCRYTKYIGSNESLSNPKIKEILGYNPRTQTLNYLIKKNGLLDNIGYTRIDRDLPYLTRLEDNELEFTWLSDLDDAETEKLMRRDIPKNFTIKFPVKAFNRYVEEDGDLGVAGTFFGIENTHCIPFEVFMYCMGNEEIGCTGFYLYAYLKHKNDIFKRGYDVPLERLVEETGIADRTLDKYLNELKGYKVIRFKHNQKFFAVGLRESERMANTYITNEYVLFEDNPVPFRRIDIMKKQDYLEMLKEEENLNIQLEQLPF